MLSISLKRLSIFSALLVGLLSVSLVAQAQEPPTPRNASSFEDLETLAKTLSEMSKEDRTDFLNSMKKYLKDTGEDLRKKDHKLAERICKDMQKIDAPRAGSVYVDFGVLLGKSNEVAQLGAQLAGIGRRLDLKGSKLVVTGKTLDDKEFELSAYKGKVVLVDFWATWCPPCVKEIPHLLKVHEKYKDRGFDIVGISFDKSRNPLEKFIDSKKIPWTNIFDPKLDMSAYYNVTGIPFTVLIDREGTVLAVNPNHNELARLLDKHLDAPKSDE